MQLLYCSACDKYYSRAEFDIATRQPGRIGTQGDVFGVRLGSRSLPEKVPWARVQRAICLDCGAVLELFDIDPCPHESDDQYWQVNTSNTPPTRKCELCNVRETATYYFP